VAGVVGKLVYNKIKVSQVSELVTQVSTIEATQVATVVEKTQVEDKEPVVEATQIPTLEATQVVVIVEPVAVADPNARVFGYLNDTTNVSICASLNSLPVDPSSVPWPKTDRELNKNIVETLEGPAVIEWWYGETLEGVWQIAEGESMTLPVGTAGHYFPQTTQLAMVQTWPLEVCNYSKKVEHVNKLLYGDLVLNPITTINLYQGLYQP